MEIYVIYMNPRDYIGKFVVRRHVTKEGLFLPLIDKNPICVVDTLEQARKFIPFGLACFQRHPEDDPVIYETWL